MSLPIPAVDVLGHASRARRPPGRIVWIACGLAALVLAALPAAYFYRHSVRALAELRAAAFSAAAENRLQDAERAANAYLSRRPSDPHMHLLLAKILTERKENREALVHLEGIPRASRWWPEAHRMQGESLWHLGYASRAEAIWLECIQEHPEAAWPRWDLLRSYFLEDRRAEAWQITRELYDLREDPVGALLDLLTFQVEPPSPLSEARVWEQCLRVEPTNYYARRSLGSCYIDLNRGPEAQRLLEDCARERPNDVIVWRSLLRGALQQGEVDAAERTIGELPEEIAGHAGFVPYRGQIGELRGDWQTAAHWYRQAADQAPWNRKVHYQLALLYRRLGDDELAERHTEIAERLHDAFTTLSHYHSYLRDPDKPQDAGLYRKVARMLDEFGRARQARMWAELADALEQRTGAGPARPSTPFNRRSSYHPDPVDEAELEALY